MSATAIQQVLNELQGLPESEQAMVLGFLQALKRRHGATPAAVARGGRNPALELRDGLLVFTGEIEGPDTDWLEVVREERDATFIREALGQSGPQ
jgi:hypothetical protein